MPGADGANKTQITAKPFLGGWWDITWRELRSEISLRANLMPQRSNKAPEPPTQIEKSSWRERFSYLTAVHFRSEDSPWLGTKLWQSPVICRALGARAARMTGSCAGCHMWLWPVILAGLPGGGLILDRWQASRRAQEGNNARAGPQLFDPFVFFPLENRFSLLGYCLGPQRQVTYILYIRVSPQELQGAVRTTAPEHRECKMTELLSWWMCERDQKKRTQLWTSIVLFFWGGEAWGSL